MIGKRSAQRSLYDVGNVFSFSPRPDSFYGQLAKAAPDLFQDEEFAEFYANRKGRPSVPPSDLALLMLMQHYTGVSDEEAVERAACDLRFAAVLRRPVGERMCAKSTLQLFRSQLIVHEKIGMVFERSVSTAREAGLLPDELRVAIDTKPILGRGAVLDTYNLLAAGVRQLGCALASREGVEHAAFFEREGLSIYLRPSIKGSEEVNWSDREARDKFLTAIVCDCRRLLEMAAEQLSLGPGSATDAQSTSENQSDQRLRDAASLLEQFLLQDVDTIKTPTGEKNVIHKGVVPGRVPSATDPEQRHGRKSASKRFTGAKACAVTETQSRIILETDVIAGDAKDSTGALSLIEQAEVNAGIRIVETLGDCAYGIGETRKDFTEANRELNVRVPETTGSNGMYAKSDFAIDLAAGTVTCPNGVSTSKFSAEADGGKIFHFGSACKGCPLAAQCTTSNSGRTIHVHPQEMLLQAARTEQKKPGWRETMKERLAVENSLARLGHLGVGQARYIGHDKTRFQVKILATVANLRRTWNWMASKGNGTGLATAS